MKRTTTAAMTGLTALVLAGGGAGMAVAYDHHPSTHPDRTPTVTVPVRTPQPAATRTTRPATTPHQRHATVHPAAPHRAATRTPAGQRDSATVPQRHHVTVVTVPPRTTTPTRTAPARVHHREPTSHRDPTRYCDDWEHGGHSGHHH